jgi:hypothetical protein
MCPFPWCSSEVQRPWLKCEQGGMTDAFAAMDFIVMLDSLSVDIKVMRRCLELGTPEKVRSTAVQLVSAIETR